MASRYRSTSAIHEGNARTVLSAFISAALRRGEKQLEAFVAVGDGAGPVHVSQAHFCLARESPCRLLHIVSDIRFCISAAAAAAAADVFRAGPVLCAAR